MSNMNVLMTNTSALFTDRQIGITNRNKEKSIEKLSSGYRINRAADDAAGLTISEKMRFYIRGLNQGANNIQDGVSLCQVADGALNEVHDMLHRMNELAVQSANETNTDEDREAIDLEVRAIKDEMTRVFETTEFNELKIFNIPYVPDASGLPDSLQMFNVRLDNGEVRYGGIEINNIRHTWSELGIDKYIGDDGVTIHVPASEDDDPEDDVISTDIKYTLKDGTGETLRLRLTDGAKLPDISRVYEWSADNEGISVNNLKAASWSDLGVTDSGKVDGFITFEHKGITYSFKTGSDSKKEMIAGINGYGLNSDGIFKASPAAYVDRSPAVDITNGAVKITVSGSNKALADDDYSISADSTGITLYRNDKDGDSSGVSATKIKWSDFTDKNGSNFRIRDFGLNDNDNSKSTTTFDHDATYTYRDSASGIAFEFKLTDEASLDAIINGLNRADIDEIYSAPGTVEFSDGGSSATDPHGGRVVLRQQYIAGNERDNLRAQKAIGRNFDSAGAVADITVKKSVTASGSKTNVTTTYSSLNLDNNTDNANDHSESRTVYIDQGDGNYKKYTETTVYGTIEGQKTKTTSYGQAYSISYSASAGGTALQTSPQTGSVTVGYRETDELKGTYTYISDYRYTYLDETVSGSEVPDGAVRLSAMKQRTGNEKDEANMIAPASQTVVSHTESKTSTPARTDNVTVTAANGVKICDLTFSTSSSDISTYTSQYTLRFSASDKAEVTFAANENSAGNITLSPKFSRFEAIQPKKHLNIQAGDDADNVIPMKWYGMNLTTLGISNTNVLTAGDARSAIVEVRDALGKISSTRSLFGAYQNRLEHAINQNKNTAENLTAAESRIRDADMAGESVRFAKENILSQAGMSMLAQANQQKQGIANLLQ